MLLIYVQTPSTGCNLRTNIKFFVDFNPPPQLFGKGHEVGLRGAEISNSEIFVVTRRMLDQKQVWVWEL